jgi:hypothetical protein
MNTKKLPQNLSEMLQKFPFPEASRIQITYKQNRVSVSCRIRGISCGASCPSYDEAIDVLKTRVSADPRVPKVPEIEIRKEENI